MCQIQPAMWFYWNAVMSAWLWILYGWLCITTAKQSDFNKDCTAHQAKNSLYNIRMILSLKSWQNLTIKQVDGMCVYGFTCVCSLPRQILPYRIHFFSGYVCAVCSVVSDSVTPWTITLQALSVHGILQARILECLAISFSFSGYRFIQIFNAFVKHFWEVLFF